MISQKKARWGREGGRHSGNAFSLEQIYGQEWNRGTVAARKATGKPQRMISQKKARWGRGGGPGEGEPLSREQRGSPSPGN